jgi:serine/threonine-protein kinase RsbW
LSGGACMENKEVKIIINSDLKHVSLVGRSIHELCVGISRFRVEPYEIELCVVEAVNNAIEHAYGKEKGHEVEVRFFLGHDRLVVDICDTGKPMDVRLLEQADQSMPEAHHDGIHAIAEQGRGLPIIKEIMDAVIYETKRGKNRLSMTKFFGS